LQPRLTVLTIGVTDLERSLRFYRDGLGFATDGIVGTEFEHGAVVFFELESGLRLALWPRTSISHDTGIPLAPPSATEPTLGHNVDSKDEVDVVMEQAREAGARIVKEAQNTFWGGYAGYFGDPDGHLWEIVWNPALEVAPSAPGAGTLASTREDFNHGGHIRMVYFEGKHVDPGNPAAIVTDCIESGAESLLLDTAALPPEFYDLSTGVLGTIVQRAVQYGIRLAAVVPDIDTRSDPLQAFVREANRGVHICFARSRDDAIRWLDRAARSG
jgi:uncharacterized protein